MGAVVMEGVLFKEQKDLVWKIESTKMLSCKLWKYSEGKKKGVMGGGEGGLYPAQRAIS